MQGKLFFLITFLSLISLAAGGVFTGPHPYLTWVHDPSTSIVVNWWNPASAGDSTVEYGPTASYGSTVHDQAVSNFHHVELTDLTPGTLYHYRINSSDGTIGNDETFATSAPHPTSLMFVVYSDSQGVEGDSTLYHERHKAQCDYIVTKKLAFVMNLGDMVNEGNVEDNWVEFFKAEQNLSKSTVIMPVLGNHEVQPNGQPYYYYFDLYPAGAAVPNNGIPGKGPRTYSFNYGNTHHIVISSYQVNKTDERNWIETDLSAAAQDPNIEWIFAHMHKPLYTSGPTSFVDTEGQNLWAPLFELYGVDIVFAGHWHFYERSYPIRGGTIVSPDEGVIYITSALGGGPFNCQEPSSPYIPFFETYYCNKTAAVYITIDKKVLTGNLITVDKEVIDTFTINKYNLEASEPLPADGSEDVALHTVLGWTPGFGAVRHDVCFGPNNPPAFASSTTETSFDPGPLEWNTTYFWRIDQVETDGITTHTGDTWSFKTIAQEATRPDPADHAVGVALDKILSWTPGVTAATHDVYFGDVYPPVFIGSQEQSSFDPGPLELNATYYWQIDEIETDGVTKYPGNIWSFKTARPGTGTILREVWEGVAGSQISDLTSNSKYPANPSFSDELSSFETPANVADNFGTRIQGWLHPETPGDYTFWIAADENAQLWLSTDQNPVNASMITHVTGPVGVREFDNTNVIPSEPIHLEANHSYYIMALYKEGIGNDNLAAAWQGPDSPTRTVIHGYFLSPFVSFWASNPYPRDGDPAAPKIPNLRWSPGITAASHEVYFSSGEQAVRDRTVQAKTRTDPAYRPGVLTKGQTYYWRVDEIEADGTTKYPGELWSFTVTTIGR